MVGNIRREISSTIQQTVPYYLEDSDDYGIDGHDGDGDCDIDSVADDGNIDGVADVVDDDGNDDDDDVAGLHQVN